MKILVHHIFLITLTKFIGYTCVKTACDILNDATRAVYFPFDGTDVYTGPNSLSVTS
jgi:hypothetical protein